MTFFLKKEVLRNNKPSRTILALVAAAAVISVGYIITLAVLAPQQLAEATAAATDLICDKCVGTTDIADSAVTSAKIGSGQVKNSDIGGNAVTSAKILDGTIVSADMADQAIISTKIADSAVTSSKLAGGAVKPNIHRVEGAAVTISPRHSGAATVDCPPGEILTGGGYSTANIVQVGLSFPLDENTWRVSGFDESSVDGTILEAWALCTGPFP